MIDLRICNILTAPPSVLVSGDCVQQFAAVKCIRCRPARILAQGSSGFRSHRPSFHFQKHDCLQKPTWHHETRPGQDPASLSPTSLTKKIDWAIQTERLMIDLRICKILTAPPSVLVSEDCVRQFAAVKCIRCRPARILAQGSSGF